MMILALKVLACLLLALVFLPALICSLLFDRWRARYILLALPDLLISAFAQAFPGWLAVRVDSNGDLPRWLRWFQPADTKCWGDELFWQNQGAELSTLERCTMWLRRNPAQGWDAMLRANCHPSDPVRMFGNPAIHDGVGGIGGFVLVLQNGYFWFNAIIPLGSGRCAITYLGWRLLDTSQNYGQFVFTPLRFNVFLKS